MCMNPFLNDKICLRFSTLSVNSELVYKLGVGGFFIGPWNVRKPKFGSMFIYGTLKNINQR